MKYIKLVAVFSENGSDNPAIYAVLNGYLHYICNIILRDNGKSEKQQIQDATFTEIFKNCIDMNIPHDFTENFPSTFAFSKHHIKKVVL